MTATLDLSTVQLTVGSHRDRDEGVCLLEAVAWFADERHGDSPKCVSPMLATFGRQLNDYLSRKLRQDLVPLVPLMVGTVDPERDETDMFRCIDWALRVVAPKALEMAGLAAKASALRSLTPIVDPETTRIAMTAAREIWPPIGESPRGFQADRGAIQKVARAAFLAVSIASDTHGFGELDAAEAVAQAVSEIAEIAAFQLDTIDFFTALVHDRARST